MDRPRRRIAVIAAGTAALVLGIVGVIVGAQGLAASQTTLDAVPIPAPSVSPAPSASPEPAAAQPASPAPAVGRSDAGIDAQQSAAVDPPVSVRVPDVGLDLVVVPVGVRTDGQMDVPELVSEVGWYRFGPEPGSDAGSSVLSGHVDSNIGPAPMAALFDVDPGALVEVTTASGAVLTYRVDTVEQLGKERLPLDDLFARDGPPVLRLVTCAGEWDPVAGAYEDNLVATAVPLSP
jgi:hypothetical protein